MRASRFLQPFAVGLLLGAASPAQVQPWIQDHYENLDFSAGQVGSMPTGWRLGPEGTTLYAAQIVAGLSCNGPKQCANVRSLTTGAGDRCFLYQVIDATPYRGKFLAFRAVVRAVVTGKSEARLLLRIHREDGSTSFLHDMGAHPIQSSSWAFYEIEAPIVPDAGNIEFGMQLVGGGSATIHNVSLTFSGSRSDGDVRSLIQKFANFRNAHDGSAAAALYAEDGQWIGINGGTFVRGRAALAALWGAVPGHVERTVDSVEFPASNIATIHVTVDYTEPAIGRHHEVFIAVKDNDQWHIQTHQTVD